MKVLLVTFSDNADHQDTLFGMYEQLQQDKDVDATLLAIKTPKVPLETSARTWLVDCPERPGLCKKTLNLPLLNSIIGKIKKEKFDAIYFESLHVWNLPIMMRFHKKVRIYHVIHEVIPHEGDRQVKLVDLMNKGGGSAAFGRWAKKSVKTRKGAQLLTMLLGVLIFVDDYFNCLTVGSVMRPVTESHKISRAKLAYIIDATAAPVCMIAPVSSWAAAVSGYVNSETVNGIQVFIQQIPYNYYCLLSLVMIIVISLLNMDYGPMFTHEYNAQVKDDLFTTEHRPFAGDDEYEEGAKKGSVLDLIIPVVVLIAMCIIGMIWTGGFFDGETFIDSFANCDASLGLPLGAIVAVVFTFIYFWCRGAIGFVKSFESVPNGFIQMVSPILILSLAWTLNSMTGSLGSDDFVNGVLGNAGALQNFLPAIIFVMAAAIAFATGTSWGTIGIMAPIVVQVFDYTVDPTLCVIGLAAACAGGVCGDHCSPISDTTIMASAGAQCNHVNHVSTQLPYALTVAAVSTVAYILAGFIRNWLIVLPIAIAMMIGTLFVIKAVTSKKAAPEA